VRRCAPPFLTRVAEAARRLRGRDDTRAFRDARLDCPRDRNREPQISYDDTSERQRIKQAFWTMSHCWKADCVEQKTALAFLAGSARARSRARAVARDRGRRPIGMVGRRLQLIGNTLIRHLSNSRVGRRRRLNRVARNRAARQLGPGQAHASSRMLRRLISSSSAWRRPSQIDRRKTGA